MLLNPQEIVNKQIVKGTVSIQPNAIDFDIDSVKLIQPGLAYISNDKTHVKHAAQITVNPIDALDLKLTYGDTHPDRELERGECLGWMLEPNRAYDVTSSAYVEVPEGSAAFLVVRSTFNRNAVSLSSGLYDSGFKGNVGFVLKTGQTPVFVEKGTFVGQIYFTESQNASSYKGGYNTKDGQHWTEAAATKTAQPVEARETVKATTKENTKETVKETVATKKIEK